MAKRYGNVLPFLSCVASVLVLGCGGDTAGPAPSVAAQYWSLTLNHHAITMATVAPYDTLTLVATPRTVTGDPLSAPGTVSYTSSDTSVLVDSTGLLQVHTTKLTKSVIIVAKMTVGGINGLTLADTALVNVVKPTSPSAVPTLDSLLIHPLPGDSAAVNGGQTKTVTARVLSTTHANIPNVQVRYRSANPLVATYSASGVITPVTPGNKVMLYADATVYGNSLEDSVLYTIGWPVAAAITIVPTLANGNSGIPVPYFRNHKIYVGVGALVYWVNQMQNTPNDSVDVVFNDTAGILGPTARVSKIAYIILPSSGGDIPAWEPQYPTPTLLMPDSIGVKGRVFSVPGDYGFHTHFSPDSGVIHVIDNNSIQ